MNHPSTEKSIRPGFLVAVVGSIAVTVALVWALKGKPSPTDVAVEAAAPVNSSASAKPAAARTRVEQAVATPVAVNPERPRWTGATRLSMSEMGTDTTAPGAATGLAGFQGTGTFDYRTQAAQVAEVVRNAIAREEWRGGATSPGSAADFAQTQGAGGPGYQTQSGPVDGVPNAMTPLETGGAAGSPGSVPQFTGAQGTGNYGAPVQAGPVAGGFGNALTPPQVGGDATSPGSAEQVSQGSGPTGAPAVNNAVEAYREGERLRRAYVEEMRVRRIVTIVDARQREGI